MGFIGPAIVCGRCRRVEESVREQRGWGAAPPAYGTHAAPRRAAVVWASSGGRSERGRGRPKRRGRLPLDDLWKLAREEPVNGKLWIEIAKREQGVERKVKALREGLDTDGSNAYLWHMMGMVYWRNGDVSDAQKIFEEAMQRCPEGSRAALFQARALLSKEQSKNTDEFIGLLKEGLEEDLSHGPIHVALANHYAANGQLDLARKAFTLGSEEAGDHAPLWRAWGVFEQREGNLIEARSKWAQAVSLEPREPRSWLNLAELEREVISEEQALESLRKGLLKNPRSDEIRVMLAKVEEKVNGAAAARTVLEERLNASWSGSPSTGLVPRALAALEISEGNIARARDLYCSALQDIERNTPSDVSNKLKTLHAWALLEVKESNLDSARQILKDAQSMAPMHPGLWRAAAEVEARARNFNESRNAFQRAVASNPTDPRLWLAWGRMELQAGELTKAEELLSRAAEDLGKDLPLRQLREARRLQSDALRELASSALRDGKFDLCRSRSRAAVEKDPTNLTAWRELADIELKQSGADAMRAVFTEALTIVPKTMHAKIYHWMGVEERRERNIPLAREAFENAVANDGTYISTWVSWALMEKEEGNVEEACRVFAKASEVAEKHGLRVPYLYVSWGRVLDRDLGDVEAARGVLQKGLEENKTFSSLYQAWGQLEERQGDISRARELYSQGCDIDRWNASLWQSRALLEARQGNGEEARRCFEAGVAAEPMNAAVLTSYAVFEGKQPNHVSDARDLFKRATVIDPSFAAAWHAWGTMELRAGNHQAAERLYHQSCKANGTDPACWHALGMLSRSVGDLDAARAHFRKALEVNPRHSLSFQSLALLEARDEGGQGYGVAKQILTEATKTLNVRTSWEVWQTLALLEADSGAMEKARNLLREAIDACPHSALYQTYGVLLSRSKDFEQAREVFETGARVSPRDAAPIFSAWGRMEEGLGKVDRARQLYKQGIVADPSNVACWSMFATMEASQGNVMEADRLRLIASGLKDGEPSGSSLPAEVYM